MNFKYISTHFPTGRSHIGNVECGNVSQFLRVLNAWNRSSDGKFMYTSADHIAHGIVAVDFKHDEEITPALRDIDAIHKAGGYWTPHGLTPKDEPKNMPKPSPGMLMLVSQWVM